MATQHHDRVIPLCGYCYREAAAVVAFPDGESVPTCPMCSNVGLDTGGTEYPLEEFYERAPGHVTGYDPYGETVFELFDPASETAWIAADNCYTESSVRLDEYR